MEHKIIVFKKIKILTKNIIFAILREDINYLLTFKIFLFMVLRSLDASVLAFRRHSQILGTEMKAVKISQPQALGFISRFTSFEDMLETYGNQKLELGEFYTGYIAVYHGSYSQEVIYMKGKVRKYSGHPSHLRDANLRLAAEKGTFYEVVDPGNIEETYPNYRAGDVHYQREGLFQFVWNFKECRFESHVRTMQSHGYLLEADAEQIDKALKYKVLKGFATGKAFELTNDENVVLKSYLGKYYKTFFTEVK